MPVTYPADHSRSAALPAGPAQATLFNMESAYFAAQAAIAKAEAEGVSTAVKSLLEQAQQKILALNQAAVALQAAQADAGSLPGQIQGLLSAARVAAFMTKKEGYVVEQGKGESAQAKGGPYTYSELDGLMYEAKVQSAIASNRLSPGSAPALGFQPKHDEDTDFYGTKLREGAATGPGFGVAGNPFGG